METGKYYLTKEEQLQREKWDWYSILKTAEMEGYAEGFLKGFSEDYAKACMKFYNKNSADAYTKYYTEGRKLARTTLAEDLLKESSCLEFIAELTELPIEEVRRIKCEK